MLKQVFLVRHAQSEEDIDPAIHGKISDHRISITSTGKNQVFELVNVLAPKISLYKRIKIVISPSNRVGQTMSLFCSHFPLIDFNILHEPCIRNLNWGNVDEHSIKEVECERYRAGVLHFQFPGGDNTPDFVRNIECFVDGLRFEGKSKKHPECTIVFTHGFALRVIAKAFLKISDEDFRSLANPPNCYVSTIDIAEDGDALLKHPLPRTKPILNSD